MSAARWLMGATGVPLATYYCTTFVQVLFHRWFGHAPRLSAIYSNHLHGHHADYRANNLTSDKWIEAERHVMWYYVVPLAPLSALAAWLLPWPLFILHVGALGFTIWWHLHLHRHYHLNESRWSRFAWFQRKRALHLRHHVHHHGNYAIVEFFWDRVLGTYDRGPLPARRPAVSAVSPDHS